MYRILVGFRGAPHGSTVVEYEAGAVVELSPALAAYAVGNKLAEVVTPEDGDAEAPAKKPKK